MILKQRPFMEALMAAAVIAAPASAMAQDVDVLADENGVQVNVDDEVSTPATKDVRQPNAAADEAPPQRLADRRTNAHVANWILAEQRSFVGLAKFGSRQASSAEVKQFSEKLVADHQKLIDTIRRADTRPSSDAKDSEESQQLANDRNPRRGRRSPGKVLKLVEGIVDEVSDGVDSVDSETSGVRQVSGEKQLDEKVERIADVAEEAIEEGRDIVQEARESFPNVNNRPLRRVDRGGKAWVKVHEDVTKELSKLAEADLKNRSGYEFDAALVGMYAASHLQQQATLEVLRQKADGELADVIDEALEAIKQHRRSADELMKNVKPTE